MLAPDALGPTLCIGEILAEIVALAPGDGFAEPIDLIGPYPSGAPAIFIDQCARMGGQATMIGAVGADDFGQVCLTRLAQDGVDISAIAEVPDMPTGTAFVRYRPDGTRHFVFNMWASAAGQLRWTPQVEHAVASAGHLHVMGTLLSNTVVWPLIERAAQIVKGRGGSLSFDPNARPELHSDDTAQDRFRAMLAMTDVLLPSGEELFHAAQMPDVRDEAQAVAALHAQGVAEVVVKRGAQGAAVFGADGTCHTHSGFVVQDVDPTGAGDCFGGAYVTARRLGLGAEAALGFGAAAGARNVTRRGPMEGAGTRAELERFMSRRTGGGPGASPLSDLAAAFHAGRPRGIVSICSAHPLVLHAAVQHARDTGQAVLIEATCNQVNHQGGYTGLTPQDFADQVATLVAEEGCPEELIILGGDHLGPNPWRDQPAEAALAAAGEMIEAYVAAGFRKLHLDASMGCAGEPDALDDALTAARAVQLAQRAEAAAARAGLPLPVYVIGTEVPPPGGADHALDAIAPTHPDAARQSVAVHRAAFESAGLSAAFDRVIALVVQPGVEFGNQNVVIYEPGAVRGLSAALEDLPGLVFEAHSTDYQGRAPLAQLVRDGFSILKVGPELTFALREALYALDLVASDLLPDYGDRPLYHAMARAMQAKPGHWARHYTGAPGEQRLMQHYSLSDRIRYYWNTPEAALAVATLFASLAGARVPAPLLRQHCPQAAARADQPLDPQHFVICRVREVLDTYCAATSQETIP